MSVSEESGTAADNIRLSFKGWTRQETQDVVLGGID